MKNSSLKPVCIAMALAMFVSWIPCAFPGTGGPTEPLMAGFAKVDITPPTPIRLAGYAGRKRPADTVDHPLLAQALAIQTSGQGTFVLVTIDNCEVSSEFMQPALNRLRAESGLDHGRVAVVSSHTHSAPVLADTLAGMPPATDPEEARTIQAYSALLREKLVEVVKSSLAHFEPVTMEHGVGYAGFAMNRRVYRGEKVVFGDNPDGPVDRKVPVLRVTSADGKVRAVVFGYACHGTSVRDGDDWYTVSGDYMGYAREALEEHQPGALAMYVPGFGADSDPSPRGPLLRAKQHGLELAGAVMGVLNRPMRKVAGAARFVYEEIPLRLVDAPDRAQLERDYASTDISVRQRAGLYLARLEKGEPLPKDVKLPTGVLRIGDGLTLLLLGGEVVVDYARRLDRVLEADHPWMVGYAYHVPCYIPSHRIIREGGYESDFSLVYYGIYGPFKPSIEDTIIERVTQMVGGLR